MQTWSRRNWRSEEEKEAEEEEEGKGELVGGEKLTKLNQFKTTSRVFFK